MYKVYIFNHDMDVNLCIASIDDKNQAISFACTVYYYSNLPVRVCLSNREQEFPMLSFFDTE